MTSIKLLYGSEAVKVTKVSGRSFPIISRTKICASEMGGCQTPPFKVAPLFEMGTIALMESVPMKVIGA